MKARLPKIRRRTDAPPGPGAAIPVPGASPDDQPTVMIPPVQAGHPGPFDAAPPTAAHAVPPAGLDPAALQVASAPSFRDRGRLRRRLSYLRRVRELGFRDLGGLVFDLHRFGRTGDGLVRAKLDALAVVDQELRALERVLGDKPLYVDLREPGIAACPRCAALHGSDARYCPTCGVRLSGPMGIGEIGGAAAPGAPAPGMAAPVAPADGAPPAAPAQPAPVPAEAPTTVAPPVAEPAPDADQPTVVEPPPAAEQPRAADAAPSPEPAGDEEQPSDDRTS